MNSPATIEMKCIEVEQPIGYFYIGKLDYKDVLEISFADIRRLSSSNSMRDVEEFSGIQRELDAKRVKELYKYVNLYDATFPNSIILHIEPKDITYDEEKSTLQIIRNKKVAKVIDGQHRIEGLNGFQQVDTKFDVITTIFVGMDIEDQAIVFSTINKTHAKVSKSLVYDLFSFAKTRSPQRTAHIIAKALNEKTGSPFKDKIKILGTAIDIEKETITQATFVESLMDFITKDPVADRDLYKRGKTPDLVDSNELKRVPFRNLFIKEEDSKIAQIIWNYFKAVEERWPIAWKQVQDEYILNRSTGFIALMKFLKDICNYKHIYEEVTKKDEFLEIFKKIKLKDNNFTKHEFIPGSTGQSILKNKFKADSNI